MALSGPSQYPAQHKGAVGHEGPTLALRLDELGEENIHKTKRKERSESIREIRRIKKHQSQEKAKIKQNIKR